MTLRSRSRAAAGAGQALRRDPRFDDGHRYLTSVRRNVIRQATRAHDRVGQQDEHVGQLVAPVGIVAEAQVAGERHAVVERQDLGQELERRRQLLDREERPAEQEHRGEPEAEQGGEALLVLLGRREGGDRRGEGQPGQDRDRDRQDAERRGDEPEHDHDDEERARHEDQPERRSSRAGRRRSPGTVIGVASIPKYVRSQMIEPRTGQVDSKPAVCIA